MKSLLITIRDSFTGPWPLVLLNVLLVAIAWPVTFGLLQDAPLTIWSFVIPSAVAASLVAFSVWHKHRYPARDSQR